MIDQSQAPPDIKLPRNAQIVTSQRPRWPKTKWVVKITVGEIRLWFDVTKFHRMGFYGYNKYGVYSFRSWESLPDLSYLERN